MQPIAYLAIAGLNHIRGIDLLIVVLYLAGITLFGLHFRGKGESLRSYFLAERTIPWWAIALSIVAAETSTLTIISIPGLAFTGDFGFLQLVLGYLVARVVLCLVFLPAYFHGELLTAYQLIDRRFGARLHKVTATVFLLTRAAAEGVRLFAISILIGIAIGTSDIASIVIITVLTLLYTIKGGMAAVIWTDVTQMFIYIGGSVAALWALGRQVPGGWSMIHQVGRAPGKFTVFHFAMNLTTTYTFWTGLIGGCFLTMASHGTGSADGPASTGSKESARIAPCAFVELGDRRTAIPTFSLRRCGTLCVLHARRSGYNIFHSGQNLPDVHRRSHACGNFGIDHCSCSGRSYVQFKRRTQFAFFHHRGRFLHEVSAERRGPGALQCFAYLHVLLGGCIVRSCICIAW